MSDALLIKLQPYLRRHYPDAILSHFALLNGGWECDIYTFRLTFSDGQSRELILRLFLGEDSVAKTLRESAGLSQLTRAGYPVPEMFLAEPDPDVLGKAFLIMEKLDGRGLWDVLNSVEPQREAHLIEQFGQLVVRLHRLDWQPFTAHAARYQAEPSAVIDDLLAPLREFYRKFEVEGFLTVTDWLEAHQQEVNVQPAVVHLDFHANNVMLDENGRMKVIDWSQVTVADARFDLAWTLMVMGDHGKPGWRQQILDAYTRAAGQAVQHLDYFTAMSDLKLLASAVISLKVGASQSGLRPQNEFTREIMAESLQRLSRRLRAVTGLTVPEAEDALDQLK